MFRLYCDSCNQEISPRDKNPMVKLTIEEMKYMGESSEGREFLSDHGCIDYKVYLCPYCAERLRQFMHYLAVSTEYNFKGE